MKLESAISTITGRRLCATLTVWFALCQGQSSACTIVSTIDRNHQVWNANNEDGPEGAAAFINVFPAARSGEYGFFTLSYSSPANGEGAGIQGGMNEAGLTFDFNEIKRVSDFPRKKSFPAGDGAILRHILGTMKSVEQVLAFFETYWFQRGFDSAQLHVADRLGKFAIIAPSGRIVGEKGIPLVSTNFDLVRKEDSSSCWRYAAANRTLASQNEGLATMVELCRVTAQSGMSRTLYSNIQNLTTGDVWFFSAREYDSPVKTNITDLVANGRRSYSVDDLKALLGKSIPTPRVEPAPIALSAAHLESLSGSYRHPFGALIRIERHENGLKLIVEGGGPGVAYPSSPSHFFWPKEDATMVFTTPAADQPMLMSVYEAGHRTFTAKRIEAKP